MLCHASFSRPSIRAQRAPIAFRSVNRRGRLGYDPELQRHHLLPRQLLSRQCFEPLLSALGPQRVGFDNFRTNGLLLPASEEASVRTGLPLHRGPHRRYNEIVIDRVGSIEKSWRKRRRCHPDAALTEANERLRLLQMALRRRLLSGAKRLVLNRNDPLGAGFDFTELDAMAESLWAAT